MNTGTENPALAAQLAQLDAKAAPSSATPAGSNAPAGGPAAPAARDWNGEAGALVGFVCAAVLPLYPSLAAVYTTNTQAQISAALGPVLEKYDFDLEALKRWPELMLAFVLVPLIKPTLDAIRADRAKSEKEKPTKQQTPIAPAGADASRDSAPAGGPPSADFSHGFENGR